MSTPTEPGNPPSRGERMDPNNSRNNVSPLDEAGKGDEVYVGARVSPERRKRYDLAAVHGDFSDRSAFIVSACDAKADEILGPIEAAAGD